MNIILASKSPRRQELLRNLGCGDFVVDPAVGEEAAPAGLSPGETVRAIAEQKASEVAARYGSDTLVIAADTLVYLDGAFLGKPKDEADASAMLHALSGRGHKVFTGVSLSLGGRVLTEFEETDVFFRSLSEGEIARYIASGEPMDKAGAYGAQGRGAVFVRRIEGDFFNVMGLPLCRLSVMLSSFGISTLG